MKTTTANQPEISRKINVPLNIYFASTATERLFVQLLILCGSLDATFPFYSTKFNDVIDVVVSILSHTRLASTPYDVRVIRFDDVVRTTAGRILRSLSRGVYMCVGGIWV